MADEILEVEARLKNFVSSEMGVIQKDMRSFANTAEKTTKRANTSADMYGKTIKKLGMMFAATFSVAMLKKWGEESIRLYKVQIEAEALLESALGRRSEELLKFASAMQEVTTFGDEQIIQSEALIANFIKEEDQIKKLMPAIMDLATAKKMNLSAAADLVTKSVASSTNAMTRYGIEIVGAAGSVERIDSAVQNLTKAFGGAARAIAQTDVGKLDQVKNLIGDVAEDFGERLVPAQYAWNKLLLTAITAANELMGVLFPEKNKPGEQIKEINEGLALEAESLKALTTLAKERGDQEIVWMDYTGSFRKESLKIAEAELRAINDQIAANDILMESKGKGPGGDDTQPPPTDDFEKFAATAEANIAGLEKQYGSLMTLQNELKDVTIEMAIFDVKRQKEREVQTQAAIDLEQSYADEYKRINNDLMEFEGDQIIGRQKMFEARVDMYFNLTSNMIKTMELFAKASKANARELKALRIAGAVMDGAAAAISAVRVVWSSAKNPYEGAAWTVATVAMIAAQTIAQVAIISQQNFARGGIVGGNSFSGDKITAGLNSGEMVLNREQQAQLFGVANGRVTNNTTSNRNINLYINGKQSMSGRDVDEMINQIGDVLIEADRRGRLDNWKAKAA